MKLWGSFHVLKKRALLLALAIFTVIFPVPTAAHASSPKIAVIYDIGGRGDGGINDAAAMGVDKAKKAFHLGPLALREIATDGTDLDRLLKIRFLANAGYSPILLVGYGFQSSLNASMDEFPNTQFAIIDNQCRVHGFQRSAVKLFSRCSCCICNSNRKNRASHGC